MKKVMLKHTVDGEFTTTDDVAEAVLFFAGAKTNALTHAIRRLPVFSRQNATPHSS